MDSSFHLSDEEINKLKVPELKEYLRQHRQPVTGNKNVLIEKAKGVRKLNLRTRIDVASEDNLEILRKWCEKLITPLGETIPDPASLTNWSDDVTLIPSFTDSDIYNYLVLTMKSKRSMRAKIYFEDSHVHSLKYHFVEENCSHCVVKSKVIPSIPTANKKQNPDHDVWVCLSKVTGKVHSAHCNCTAGEGEACNHIGAMLYALEDVSKRKADGTLSSTSAPCKWNNPRKRKLSPKKAQELKFSTGDSDKRKKVSLSLSHSNEVQSKAPKFQPTIDENRFKNTLIGNKSNAGWLTFFQTQKEIDLPGFHKILHQYHDKVDLQSDECQLNFGSIFSTMYSNITEEEVVKIEKYTRGQHNNDLWHEARKLRITSSNFGAVVKRKVSQPDNLLKTLLGYETFDNKYVKWGRDHEPAARRSYANKFVKIHEQFCVAQSGFLVNRLFPHLGSSPDGLISCTCCGEGILEIKCPSSDKWKNATPEDCALDDTFFCKMSDDNIMLKKNHNYYYQVQGQLAISGRKYCDFVVWTLKGFSVQRIKFDENFWSNMLCKLNKFYLHAVLPELYSSRVKRGLPLFKDT
ncbi:hypothetical protein FSP39_018991 [Pinctada imbricata]|uniref:SWIM-type domain-containing protein n=1 Tax=Pinctada imbricata TaxID=66713 RepID=A0AA89CA50_PINIB|nr:hypothetical protein FSP39_018991 [Pinctada imbricata]